MKLPLLPVALATGIVLAAAAPRTAGAADPSLKRFVLTPRDIPASLGTYRTASPASLGIPNVGATHRPVSHAHGFQGANGSFLSPKHMTSSGIILIDDGVYRFSSSSGAHWYLTQNRKGALLTHAHVSSANIGSEGVAWSEGSNMARSVFLFWRNGRYVAEVTLELHGRSGVATNLTLGRIIDAKLSKG